MNQSPSKKHKSAQGIPDSDQISEKVKHLMAKVSWGKDSKVFVVGSGAIMLTPQLRARLMNPITGAIPSLGLRIKQEIMSLKQKADTGDEEALHELYDVATMGVVALESVHNLETVKSIAQNKSIWPVMGVSEDSMIKRNNETFARIGLGSNLTTRAIPDLLRHNSDELYWAGAIWVEINRIRDFLSAVAPETRAELFSKAEPIWPCTIANVDALLKADVILACEKLPELDGHETSINSWWILVEKIFEIVTDGRWEEIPNLKKTHQRAAENKSSDFASIRTYIRSNIKKNLKSKFFTRIAPPKKSQPLNE